MGLKCYQNGKIKIMKEKVLEGSWIINATVEDVYRIISDFENAPTYFPLVAKGMRVISRDGNNLEIEAITNTFGINFKVKMKTTLMPDKGFKSVNESSLAIEDEKFILEPVAQGTRIKYVNKVKIKNNILFIKSIKIILLNPSTYKNKSVNSVAPGTTL